MEILKCSRRDWLHSVILIFAALTFRHKITSIVYQRISIVYQYI